MQLWHNLNMHKRQLHHLWIKLRWLNYWFFLGAFILSATVAVFALRHNDLTALYLKDKVLQTDQQNGDTEAALRTLRQYVYSHMNTDLSTATGVYPPIQLKHRYDQLVAAEKNRVANLNSQVYTDAQNLCEQLYPHSLSGGPRVPCIQGYVTQHGATERPIPDALYKFAFTPPVWSPDLAGWSLVAAAVFLLLFLVRFALEQWLKHSVQE